jgi:hypothetical protein
MKKHLFFSFVACLVISAGFLMSVTAVHGRTAVAAGEGRLVVTRSPQLGTNIIVDMMIDGKKAVSMTYGHSFETTLSAGTHVLSVLPTPRPVYRTPWEMTLNIESGKTYRFSVQSGPGHLVLGKL